MPFLRRQGDRQQCRHYDAMKTVFWRHDDGAIIGHNGGNMPLNKRQNGG
jgi:hypothetical protein